MTSQDPLEKAILSGALTGQQLNEQEYEPRRSVSPSSSSVHSEDHEVQAFQPPTTAEKPNNAPATRGQAMQTGPKGVLSDFKASKARAAQKQTISLPPPTKTAPVSDSESDDEETRAYVSARMADMRLDSRQRGGNENSKRFGQLREINAAGFEKAVLDEENGVKVIVHLYADIDRCHMLNAHLITLTHDYPYAKFLIISAQDLDFAQDSGDVVLPTLLVYQDGELIANLVAIDTAWGRELEYSVDEVKRVLIEHEVLELRPGEFLTLSSRKQQDEEDDI